MVYGWGKRSIIRRSSKCGGGDAGNGLQDKHAAARCISHPWDIPHPTPAEWSGLPWARFYRLVPTCPSPTRPTEGHKLIRGGEKFNLEISSGQPFGQKGASGPTHREKSHLEGVRPPRGRGQYGSQCRSWNRSCVQQVLAEPVERMWGQVLTNSIDTSSALGIPKADWFRTVLPHTQHNMY